MTRRGMHVSSVYLYVIIYGGGCRVPRPRHLSVHPDADVVTVLAEIADGGAIWHLVRYGHQILTIFLLMAKAVISLRS